MQNIMMLTVHLRLSFHPDELKMLGIVVDSKQELSQWVCSTAAKLNLAEVRTVLLLMRIGLQLRERILAIFHTHALLVYHQLCQNARVNIGQLKPSSGPVRVGDAHPSMDALRMLIAIYHSMAKETDDDFVTNPVLLTLLARHHNEASLRKSA